MPVPTPRTGESKNDFVGRCIEEISDEYKPAQATAICFAKWNEKKSMTPDQELLKLIRQRKSMEEFNYGILPADIYVRTMEQNCGLDLCYKYAAKGSTSYHDALIKSSKKLTYNNPEMVLQDVYSDFKSKVSDLGLSSDDIELPKNTLMVFRHVLTTSRKDRDGDILRTKGINVDPKMLLLWQHVHTIPIGKMLGVVKHTEKSLEVITAIVDVNDTANDAAVLVENKMGRFSHGFKALEFEKIKGGGFDVSKSEVMEESLVSVPANVDAETQEIYLSMIEGKQLRSGLMKSFGERLREGRPTSIPVNVDLKVTLNGKSIRNDDNWTDTSTTEKVESEAGEKGGKGENGCSCGGAGSSEQENDDATTTKEQEGSNAKEMICPECGSKMTDGVCKKCGYEMKSEKTPEELDVKAGRVLSQQNFDNLLEARNLLQDIAPLIITFSGRDRVQEALNRIVGLLAQAGLEEEEKQTQEITIKQASTVETMSFFLQKATQQERQRMLSNLELMEVLEKRATKREKLKSFLLRAGTDKVVS